MISSVLTLFVQVFWYRNIPKYWLTYSIGAPLQFVKIIIFRDSKNWTISKIAKIFSNFLYHMNWDSAFGWEKKMIYLTG